MTFTFGERSRQNLEGVHPDMVALAEFAIGICAVDFSITEGRRSPGRQAELVAAGKSKTLHGKHIIGHAVDTAARIDGAVSWEQRHYCTIAAAFQEASRQLGIPVVWGACWDRQLASLGPDLAAEVLAYTARHEGKDFLDFVHFELRAPLPDPPVTA
jgi:peptidoglycan LD-endopeptidase CwlK